METYRDMSNVLITDDVDQQCVDILQSIGFNVEKDLSLAKNSEQLIEKMKNVDILIVRSATKVTAKIIENSPRLKLIGRAGTGTDNIDTDSATKHGILVMNTPGANTLSAAEHTCALICSLSRSIPAACASIKSSVWERSKFMGEELNGKTLAIIGLGRIGRETIGYDPIITAEQSATFDVEFLSFDQIWPIADYITIHVPLMNETKHLINAEVFSKCKKGVRVVNVARGGIVDEKALLEALKTGQCGGVALDVFEEEPPKDFTLIKHENVIATPHLGANTKEAQKRVAIELAEQIRDFKMGISLIGVVNGSAVMSQFSNTNRSLLVLSRSLGELLIRINKHEDISSPITISCHKSISPMVYDALAVYFSFGYLHELGNSKANFVNAQHLLEEKGIEIRMTSGKHDELLVIHMPSDHNNSSNKLNIVH
ncbi:unnamed protein product, partial [Didymodactylos carnosus]